MQKPLMHPHASSCNLMHPSPYTHHPPGLSLHPDAPLPPHAPSRAVPAPSCTPHPPHPPGLSLRHKIPLGVGLSSAFFKVLSGQAVDLEDLRCAQNNHTQEGPGCPISLCFAGLPCVVPGCLVLCWAALPVLCHCLALRCTVAGARHAICWHSFPVFCMFLLHEVYC